jgi:hypothetical protein
MMMGTGGVMPSFVSTGEVAAVGEVVAGCGMEREPVSPAADEGDAEADVSGAARRRKDLSSERRFPISTSLGCWWHG